MLLNIFIYKILRMDIKSYFSKTVHINLIKKVYFLLHENPHSHFSVNDVCEFSNLNRKQAGYVLTILVRLKMVYREVKKTGVSNRYLYRAR